MRTVNSQEIFKRLHDEWQWAREQKLDSIHVRVWVRPSGRVEVCTGLADYDDDHRGYCAAGEVSPHDTLKDLDTLALDMVRELAEVEENGGLS